MPSWSIEPTSDASAPGRMQRGMAFRIPKIRSTMHRQDATSTSTTTITQTKRVELVSEEENRLDIHEPFDDDDEYSNSTAPGTHSTQSLDGASSSSPTSPVMHLQDLIEEVLTCMRRNGTTRRGKRKNAVHWFVASKPALQEKIAHDYTQALFDRNVIGNDDIAVHLHAATRLVQNYVNMQDYLLEMIDLLPDDLTREGYKTPHDFVFGFIETHLMSHKAMHYDELTFGHLSAGQAAQVMCWIDSLISLMARRCPRTTLTPAWQHDLDKMWDHYLQVGVRQQLRQLFRNSMELMQKSSTENGQDNSDIRADRKGEMVTEYPEQIAFIVDSQIRAACEHLPSSRSSTKYSKYVHAVLVECHKEISTHLVPELGQWIETGRAQLSAERFCAIINDASRLSEMMEERTTEHALALLVDDDDNNGDDNQNDNIYTSDVLEWGHRVARELAELSLHATRLLCERIVVDDLCQPNVQSQDVLSSVGRLSWAQDDQGTAVLRTIATFRDYFADLQIWLPADYYFPKILRHCFDLTLQNYVHFFYSNTLMTGVKDPAIVSKNLSQDFLNLTQFFNDIAFEEYAGKAGALSSVEINSRLQIIQSMSRLVNHNASPSDLQEDAEKVLRHTKPAQNGNGDDGDDSEEKLQHQRASAVLHLVGIRQRHQDHQRSAEWLQVIAQAQVGLNQPDNAAGAFLTIQLPDLLHSRHMLSRPARAFKDILHQTTVPQQKIRNFIANKKVALNL